jgi:D-sedoheptulose 7-phosphate isomerase
MSLDENKPVSVVLVGHIDAAGEVRDRIRGILGATLTVTEEELDVFMARDGVVLKQCCSPTIAKQIESAVAAVGGSVQIIEDAQFEIEPTHSSSISLTEAADFSLKYIQGLTRTLDSIDVESLQKLANQLIEARRKRRTIFVLGNGGSAALASHFATDLMKDRFGIAELRFRVSSITDNAALITATANDIGYADTFVEQLKPWVESEDVVIAISSSGNSENVLRAIRHSNSKGAHTVGILGFDGGAAESLVNTLVKLPCRVGQYGFAEDATSAVVHMVSLMISEHDSRMIETKDCYS